MHTTTNADTKAASAYNRALTLVIDHDIATEVQLALMGILTDRYGFEQAVRVAQNAALLTAKGIISGDAS